MQPPTMIMARSIDAQRAISFFIQPVYSADRVFLTGKYGGTIRISINVASACSLRLEALNYKVYNGKKKKLLD